MRIPGFALVRIVAFALISLGFLSLTEIPAAAQEVPKVTVTQARQIDFVGQVAITGSLVARDEVMVNPHIGGQQITAIHVDIGDRVKAGDLLAELDSATLSVQVAQARAELERANAAVLQARAQVSLSEVSLHSAKTNYQRDKTLLQRGTVTQSRFDQSETAYETAQASMTATQQGLAVAEAQVERAKIQLKLAELNLSYTRITATAAGLISSRNASIGAVANAGPEPMFRIIRDNLIEVSTDVIETDIARIEIGDHATVRIAGVGEIDGTVRLISPRVDPRSRLGEVRISLPADPALRIGIFASGWITTEQYRAIGIAASAVLSDSEGDYAQVVDGDGIIHQRRLETGLVWNGMREIRSGLSAGDTVVLLAGAFFRDGDRISPILSSGKAGR